MFRTILTIYFWVLGFLGGSWLWFFFLVYEREREMIPFSAFAFFCVWQRRGGDCSDRIDHVAIRTVADGVANRLYFIFFFRDTHLLYTPIPTWEMWEDSLYLRF